MQILSYEDWLSSDPKDGYRTMEQSLLALWSETGATRETDFSLENELEEAYQTYQTYLGE